MAAFIGTFHSCLRKALPGVKRAFGGVPKDLTRPRFPVTLLGFPLRGPGHRLGLALRGSGLGAPTGTRGRAATCFSRWTFSTLSAPSLGGDVPRGALGGPRCPLQAEVRLPTEDAPARLRAPPRPPQWESSRKGGWERGTRARFRFIWGAGGLLSYGLSAALSPLRLHPALAGPGMQGGESKGQNKNPSR